MISRSSALWTVAAILLDLAAVAVLLSTLQLFWIVFFCLVAFLANAKAIYITRAHALTLLEDRYDKSL